MNTLRPSSSHRWLNCPGSKYAESPSPSSPAAEAGSILHAQAAAQLSAVAALLPNGYKTHREINFRPSYDETDNELIARYVSTVMENIVPGSHLHIERTLHHADIPELQGTPDVVIKNPSTVIIVDLKTGFHSVSAKENSQLGIYGLLARIVYGVPNATVIGIIVQRGRAADKYEFSEVRLTEIEDRINVALGSDKRVAGDHCQWCPLLRDCRTAYDYALEIFK